jgi:hypothetical protein
MSGVQHDDMCAYLPVDGCDGFSGPTGVEVPMPVILLGALGGMATAGIPGMFVGATLLTLGYQIFMDWVAATPHAGQAQAESDAPSAH